YVVKTDSLGTMQWQRNYGGYYGDYCYSVLKTPDSGFLLGGVNSGNYWIIKIDSTGNQLWNQTFNYGQNDVCYSICQAADGSLLLAGTVETSPGCPTACGGIVNSRMPGCTLAPLCDN
ncbi:MAG: hypothetical protein NTW14_11640, partial [bacterium]|nr:hypothetical protein [bacterium]